MSKENIVAGLMRSTEELKQGIKEFRLTEEQKNIISAYRNCTPVEFNFFRV